MSPRPMASEPSRRDVLHGGTAAILASGVAPYARLGTPRAGGAEMLRVGLVGCGGRGTGAAAQALRADPNTKLVAMGDVFADHLLNSLQTLQGTADIADRVDVPPDHGFVGFDAYKRVVDACDVVLFATSPHFRPMQVEYAAQQGKHMFVEKPVATDAPGLRRIRAACDLAREKGLAVVSGLCYRYQHAKRETIARIHDGAVGDIVALETTYDTGGLWHRGRQEGWSDMEWQIRNWLYFTWLSGDHITEQHIHSLDKLAWAMDAHPIRAKSSGGRIVRTDPKFGNVYDHFNTVYEWENGVKGFSSCRQWVGAAANVSDFVYGTKGKAAIQAHRIEGENPWRWRSDEPDDMYQNEHDELFASIRAGVPIDNSDYMIASTLMAIMGRMSAYTGTVVTAEQVWNSQLDLSPPAYEWGPLEVRPVARPGVTPFV